MLKFCPEYLENRHLLSGTIDEPTSTSKLALFQLHMNCVLGAQFTLENDSLVALNAKPFPNNPHPDRGIFFSSESGSNQFKYEAAVDLQITSADGNLLAACTLHGQSGIGLGSTGTIPADLSALVRGVHVPVITKQEVTHLATWTFQHGAYVEFIDPFAILQFNQNNVFPAASVVFSTSHAAMLTIEQSEFKTVVHFGEGAVHSGTCPISHHNIHFDSLVGKTKEKLTSQFNRY